ATNYPNALLPRKTSKDIIMTPVPRTNTRGRGEYPQASEQTIVKELGKLAP
ncbi:15884_t:CDS:1, partial [Cetraspora pellucida]